MYGVMLCLRKLVDGGGLRPFLVAFDGGSSSELLQNDDDESTVRKK